MQFGIKTPPQHCRWQDMLDVWRATDEIDQFSSCWNFDHFYPLVGDANGPCMEAWVTLTALAAHTSRVRIGCMVQGTPYRHPAVTANMAATPRYCFQRAFESGPWRWLASRRMRSVRD